MGPKPAYGRGPLWGAKPVLFVGREPEPAISTLGYARVFPNGRSSHLSVCRRPLPAGSQETAAPARGKTFRPDFTLIVFNSGQAGFSRRASAPSSIRLCTGRTRGICGSRLHFRESSEEIGAADDADNPTIAEYR